LVGYAANRTAIVLIGSRFSGRILHFLYMDR
jgi:hypothetical protein